MFKTQQNSEHTKNLLLKILNEKEIFSENKKIELEQECLEKINPSEEKNRWIIYVTSVGKKHNQGAYIYIKPNTTTYSGSSVFIEGNRITSDSEVIEIEKRLREEYFKI